MTVYLRTVARANMSRPKPISFINSLASYSLSDFSRNKRLPRLSTLIRNHVQYYFLITPAAKDSQVTYLHKYGSNTSPLYRNNRNALTFSTRMLLCDTAAEGQMGEAQTVRKVSQLPASCDSD